MTLLKAISLQKTIQGPTPLEILKDISLELQKGESVAILGRSGSGKSTLLHILGTLDSPTKGQVLFPLFPELSPEALRSHKIGFVFQAFHLLEEYTLLDNILMPAKIARRKPAIPAELLLERVGLQDKIHTPLKYLSGGEKQRAALARALCNNPDLLLVDEPTGSLDNAHAKIVQDLLLSAVQREGKTLLLVTHDEDFAKRCDRVYWLKEGRLSL